MKRITSVLAVGVLALGGMAVASPEAHADERICRGTLRAVTVDDLRVPSGATCTLVGTRVEGNIKVGGSATLLADKVRVDGNVQSAGHTYVRVRESRVGGSVQLENGGRVLLRQNQVKGDIQLFSNRRSGTKVVDANRVDGNLQCKSNSPAPTGSGNVVGGNKEDQCRRL